MEMQLHMSVQDSHMHMVDDKEQEAICQMQEAICKKHANDDSWILHWRKSNKLWDEARDIEHEVRKVIDRKQRLRGCGT